MTSPAIERMYKVFSRHRLRTTFEGCPCCWDPDETYVLRSTHLSKLTAAELYNYEWSATWTCGDEQDLKYFLPRILELTLTPQPHSPEIEVILGILNRIEWMTWPPDERDAILGVLEACWEAAFTNFDDVTWPGQVLVGLAHAKVPLTPYLDRWLTIDTDFARTSLAETIRTQVISNATTIRLWRGPDDHHGSDEIEAWLKSETVQQYLFAGIDLPPVELALDTLLNFPWITS